MLIIKDHLSLVDQEPPDHPDHQRKPVTVKELFPDRRHFDNLLNFKGQKTLPRVCKKSLKEGVGYFLQDLSLPRHPSPVWLLIGPTRGSGRSKKPQKPIFVRLVGQPLSPNFPFSKPVTSTLASVCQFRNFPLEDGLRLWTLEIFAISIFWQGKGRERSGGAIDCRG